MCDRKEELEHVVTMGDDEQLSNVRQMARRVCVCVRGQRCVKVLCCNTGNVFAWRL